jgi:type VI secretion system protein VasD
MLLLNTLFRLSVPTAFLSLLLVMGCSTPTSITLPGIGIQFGEKPETKEAKPESTKLGAAFTTSSKLNLAPSGRASPLMVRLYELKSFRAFEKADFFSLYENDKETLGADLLERDELQFKPGEARRYPRDLHADTRYIGVIAAYRDIDNAEWRAIIEVKPFETNHIIVHLGTKAVSITKLEEDSVSKNKPTSLQNDLDLETDVEEAFKTYQKYKGLPEKFKRP